MKNVKWLRKGNFIYSLKSISNWKGKELLENDITVDIKCFNSTDQNRATEIADKIINFLNME